MAGALPKNVRYPEKHYASSGDILFGFKPIVKALVMALYFPFGQVLKKVEQTERTPKKPFVLGVYANPK